MTAAKICSSVPPGWRASFRENGAYDGWGMPVSIPCASIAEDNSTPPEAMVFIEQMEKDREISQ